MIAKLVNTFPIIIGISEPVYSEEQLQEFVENSKQKYDLTQQQRAMETKLRSLKTQRLAASAAGDELEAKRIQRKINEQQTIYRRFSEKHNLLYDTQRASVEGYRRISVKLPSHFIKSDIIIEKSPDGSPALSKQFKETLILQADKFEKTFGEIAKVKEIRTMRYENDGIWGTYNDNSEYLTLYGHGGKDGINKISKLSKKMKSDGKWSTGSPFHIFRHELSHSWLKSQKSKIEFETKLQEIEELKNNIIKTLTGDIENDKIIMKNKLSIYGLSPTADIDDLICECMAEYLNGKPRSFSNQVVQILLRE